jgi:hypothetical protein
MELETKYDELLKWRGRNADTFISWLVCQPAASPLATDLVSDVNDDFKRELAFYQQALNSVQSIGAKDFFHIHSQDSGEAGAVPMLKNPQHMKKIQKRQESEQDNLKKIQEAQRLRAQKKFSKEAQKHALQKKQAEQAAHTALLKDQKRKRSLISKQEDPFSGDDESDTAPAKKKSSHRPASRKSKPNTKKSKAKRRR